MPPSDKEHYDHQMIKVEVNLDDMSGEWMGYVLDLLFEAGVNDAFYAPIYMKKNRPAVLLQVLCHEDQLDAVKQILLKETTTLGLRYYPLTVFRAERFFLTVKTQWGDVTVKCGVYQGEIIQAAPEYEDCKKLAGLHNVPLQKVYKEAWREIENQHQLFSKNNID